MLGYGFNPVSFYYIDSKEGEPFAAVAEVVNTFREMKLYAIESIGADGLWHRRVAKNFYVSPVFRSRAWSLISSSVLRARNGG